MNGAECLVKSLLACGVDTCFANPGTSEMHFVAALDHIPGMRCVLGLQENVVTGMADGYYRIAGKPACTLLHCGPGLANGLANLHNARRAQAGIVNLIGDQASYHRPYDPPLTADTFSLASAVSAWVRTATDSQRLPQDAAQAVQAARRAPGQISSLIVPAEISWNEAPSLPQDMTLSPPEFEIDPFCIERSAKVLRSAGNKVLLLLGGTAATQRVQQLAWLIASTSQAGVMFDYTLGAVRRGRDCPPIGRVPYPVDSAQKVLEQYEHIILVNAQEPVAFFAYPGKPSVKYPPDASVYRLTRPEQDAGAALEALARILEVDPDQAGGSRGALQKPEPAQGEFSPQGLSRSIAALMPEHGIVVDESISYLRDFYSESFDAPPHDSLHLAGGAIGNGMPLAAGAAIGAAGQRRVINLQADGSAMYTVQALWTQAREKLPVTTVLLNNSKYNILINEYQNVGARMGPTAESMLDLSGPNIDWVKLANSMGVEACRAQTLSEFNELFRASLKQDGPFLIELPIA